MVRPSRWRHPFFVVVLAAGLAGAPDVHAVAVTEAGTHAGGAASNPGGHHGRISPDGKLMVFVVDERSATGARATSSLFLRRVDRPSRAHRLTDGAGRDDFPAWSADGKSVYFQSDRGGLTKIWSVGARGGKPVQMTFGASQDYHPAPSPSGRYLAYDTNRSGNYDVWIRDLTTGEERQVTTAGGPDFSPTWSPQEKALAFTSNRGEGFQIYLHRLDKPSAPIHRLTSGSAVHAHPAWSPSGDFLAYDRDERGVVNVWVMEMSRPYRSFRVAGAPWAEDTPSWYPDSQRLLYTITQTGERRLGTAPLPPVAAAPSPMADIPEGPQEPLTQVAAVGSLPVPGLLEPLAPPEDLDFIADVSPAEGGGDRSNSVVSFASDESRSSRGPARGEVVPDVGWGGGQGSNAMREERREDMRAPAALAGLKVLQFFPKLNPEGVEPPRALSVVFNERLASVQQLDALMTLVDDQGTLTPLVCSYNPNLRRIDAMPAGQLAGGRTYTVRLSERLSGEAGEPLAGGFTWSFTTKGGEERVMKVTPVENVPFSILETSPSDGDARPDSRIVCRFSKALDPATVQAGSIMLFDGRGAKLAGEVLFPDGNDTLQLTPYDKLKAGQRYRVFVAQNLRSSTGDALQGAHVFSFETATGSPLVVADYEPKGFLGATADITLHFNRAVASDTLSTGKVFLSAKNQTYGGNTILGMDGLSLLFVPHRRLPNKTEFTLVLPPGLADRQGNELVLDKPIVFSTRYEEKEAAADVGSILERHGGGNVAGPDTAAYLQNGKTDGVGPKSWAYKSLVALSRKGYVDKNLGGELGRGTPLTRYKTALLVESAMKSLRLMTSDEAEQVKRLTTEFKGELHSLGVKLTGALAPQGNVLVGRG